MTTLPYPKVYLYRRIVQAKLFMDNTYADKIDVTNIANEAHFSRFHFIRLFKQVYGKTPHQYLVSVRIEKAIQLLRAGTPVSEVCYAVGFESPGSFSSLFKRVTGTKASAFLIQQRHLKAEVLQTPFKFIPGCYAYQNGWTEEKL